MKMHATSSRRMHYTYSEYLALEDLSDVKHEYFDGEIYAMAGGTPDHSALAFSALQIIAQQLPARRGCRVYTSDLRIRTNTGLSTYPDGAVVCGGSRRAVDDPIAVTNPLLLVEVTSDSTEKYDRGNKLEHYQSIPSLEEVIFISHRESRITVHRRDGERWTVDEVVAGQSARLESIDGKLDVDAVYRIGLEDVTPRN